MIACTRISVGRRAETKRIFDVKGASLFSTTKLAKRSGFVQYRLPLL